MKPSESPASALPARSPPHPPSPTASRPADPVGEGVDPKPLVGGEINLRLAISPGTITLLATPVTVLVAMLVGWVILHGFGLPTYPGEMLAGAIANTLGGVVAAIPLFIWMRKGAIAIAQAGLLGIALRMGIVLTAMLIALAPAWGLNRAAVVGWVLGDYFPLLIVETALVAWLLQKSRH
jgi:hypothetical protein